MTTLIKQAGVPIGTIVAFAGNLAQIPDGFLTCNGGLINRNTYADLFEAIGTAWGTLSGADFRLPDTRGLKLRGVANGVGADPDRASRNQSNAGGNSGDNVGSYQTDRYQSHLHSQPSHTHGGSSHNHRHGRAESYPAGSHGETLYGVATLGFSSNWDFTLDVQGGQGVRYQAYTSSATGTTGGGGNQNTGSSGATTQTTGENVYVEYIIKY